MTWHIAWSDAVSGIQTLSRSVCCARVRDRPSCATSGALRFARGSVWIRIVERRGRTRSRDRDVRISQSAGVLGDGRVPTQQRFFRCVGARCAIRFCALATIVRVVPGAGATLHLRPVRRGARAGVGGVICGNPFVHSFSLTATRGQAEPPGAGQTQQFHICAVRTNFASGLLCVAGAIGCMGCSVLSRGCVGMSGAS